MSANVSPDHYVFFANDGVSGKEVWVTDGTEAGTFMLKNIGPGSQDLGYNGRLMPLPDGRVMFLGNDGAGDKLWATDGTSEGTVILRDAQAGFINDYFAMADGRLLFQMFDGSDAELWISDGTSDGTMLLKNINSIQLNGGSMPSGFTALDDGRVIFSANDGTHGREVWVTDGTADGTVLVKDINPGTDNWNGIGAGSDPAFFTRLGDGRLIFRAEDEVHGNELWVTDGTEAGTQLLKDIAPAADSSYMTEPATLPDGRVVFSADMGGNVGRELWITDGTTAGTTLVKDIEPGSGSSYLGDFTSLSDGRMVFMAQTTAAGYELWVTDGSAAGTFMLKEINPGAANGYPNYFTPLADGRLVFSAASASNGYELWVTDGTANGTAMVADMVAGADNFYPQNFTALKDGRVSFTATDGNAGLELWITDGTAAGTYQVKDINQGPGNSEPGRLQAVTPPSNAAPTGEPDVAGTPTQGQVLTASHGTLADADGFDSAAVTYHWQRESGAGQFTDIADATGPTYTLTQDDVGHQVRVMASYTDGRDNAESVAGAPTAAIANVNDVPQGTPAVTGMLQQGAVLTADIGTLTDADGLDSTSVQYRWQRGDGHGDYADIADAAGAQYTLTQADVGHEIRVMASYTDGFGQAEEVPGTATAAIANVNDAPQGTPAVTGMLQQGAVLTAGIGTLTDADGLDGTSVQYRWQRGDGHDGWVDIDGANAEAYTLVSADVGHSIRAVAHYTDLLETAEMAASLPTARIGDDNVLVDDAWYFAKNGDVLAAGMDAETHYAQYGWQEGRDPNAYFSTTGYLSANADVRDAGINPLGHYLEYGWREGRDPSANFDNENYLARNPDVAAEDINPLQHYLTFGQYEGRAASLPAMGPALIDGFDAEYYLLRNPDVGFGGVDALAHWQSFGWQEGRDPNALFDASAYLERYADVAEAGINPLEHYMMFGATEGRIAGNFDAPTYLLDNPDVAAAGVDAMTHFLLYGSKEGRDVVFIDS
jgi:ELWxxDGT repeat protein